MYFYLTHQALKCAGLNLFSVFMRISPEGSPVKVTKVTSSLKLEASTMLQEGSYSVFDDKNPDIIITRIMVTLKNCETKISDMCDVKISYQKILELKDRDAGYTALAKRTIENFQMLGM